MVENTDAAPVSSEMTATPDGPMVQLQIGDIENAVKVIDFAADQGAFKGWGTINEVMAIRNRLVVFLRSVTPAQEAASGEATTETATSEGGAS